MAAEHRTVVNGDRGSGLDVQREQHDQRDQKQSDATHAPRWGLCAFNLPPVRIRG